MDLCIIMPIYFYFTETRSAIQRKETKALASALAKDEIDR